MEIVQISCDDKEYPSRLLKIKNYPKKLYAVGNVGLLNKDKVLGIVGSRECSEYGRKVAMEFSKELSKKDIAIISGMAIGIDCAAHMGAVENIRKNNCCTRVWTRLHISKRK
jgi:DNA processing protein